MKIKHLVITAGLLLSVPASGLAQTPTDTSETEDLMSLLEDEKSETGRPGRDYVTATFKSTRLINGKTIEQTGKGVLDFRISHRFGMLNTGVKNFFGLDNATVRLGLDYGLTDWLMIGIGRSSYEKEYDGFVKARLLRQTTGNSMPLSLGYSGGISVQTMDMPMPEGLEYFFSNRLFFYNQLILARKFSNAFSLQLMPTHVHYNLVDKSEYENDMLALGAGGRIKLSNRIALNAEYYYVLPGRRFDHTYHSLSLGFDIETGGHVFQLHVTNSTGMTERTFIGQTTGQWAKGDIHFGFNISRVFTIVRPKAFEGSRNTIW